MSYKWNAEEYYKNSSEQYKWAKELISKLYLNGNEKILDIGCGDGKITAEFAKLLPHGFVIGIDNSMELLEFAIKNFPQDKYPNLTFIYENAIDLDFENEFDIIFSNATLHWIKDHLRVLKGIKKSLKRDGKVLLQMGGKGNAEDLIKVLDNMIKSDEWKSYFYDFDFPYSFYDVDDYKIWLQQVNLREKKIELIQKDMIHQGEEKFKNWIKTTWHPYTHRIPDELREKFIDELTKNYLIKFPADRNGLVHVKMIRLEVIAER